MTTAYIRNRHSGLGCFLDKGHVLIRCVLLAVLNPGKHFYSISIVRRGRMTRPMPRFYLHDCVRFKLGLLQVTPANLTALRMKQTLTSTLRSSTMR